jgi:hypothetical protein
LLAALALGNTSCAATIIMVTDYDKRRPQQYQWLYVDAGVVGTSLIAGGVLYAERRNLAAGSAPGLGLLAGAGIWTAYSLMFLSLLQMPKDPGGSSPPAIQGGVVRQ